MQCPECEVDVGAGEPVFERIRQGGSEWVCSTDCCNKREPQGELWSTWKPAVCVEERVELHGAKVKKAGFGGKALQKEMGVILPDDASIDQLNVLAMLDVKLVIVRGSIQSVVEKAESMPDDFPEAQVMLVTLCLPELKDLQAAGLYSVRDVLLLHSVEALIKHTGLSRSRARSVMKKCKAAKK